MESDEKICPRCAETVKAAALVCKHCQHEFAASPRVGTMTTSPAPTRKKIHTLEILGAITIVAAILFFVTMKSAVTPYHQNSPVETADVPSFIEVTAVQLAEAYKANEVAAQNQYGGQNLIVTGVVSGVTLDFLSNPIIEMVGENEFLPVQAKFSDADKNRLAHISKGETVTMRCTSITEIISAPMLSDCSLP